MGELAEGENQVEWIGRRNELAEEDVLMGELAEGWIETDELDGGEIGDGWIGRRGIGMVEVAEAGNWDSWTGSRKLGWVNYLKEIGTVELKKGGTGMSELGGGSSESELAEGGNWEWKPKYWHNPKFLKPLPFQPSLRDRLHEARGLAGRKGWVSP